MPFWRRFPAALYMFTWLVNTASRLIYVATHKIFSVFRKRVPPLTEINEEPHNVSPEAWKNNSTGVPHEEGILELEQMQKQKTFPQFEIQDFKTMENFPNDLLLNIFIHLSAKQLAQMRSVSKSWNALLSQSSFIKSHLHHSINNKDRIFLVFNNEESFSNDDDDEIEPFTAHPCQSPHLEPTHFIALPLYDLNYEYTPSMINIIGSVHGLICSHYDYEVIHIWNPSLSSILTLPPHYIPSHGCYQIFLRFGFDPQTDDYKVVKLIGLTESGSPIRQLGTDLSSVVIEWLQVEVYSMRRGSWEFITQRFPSHVTMIFDEDYVCVDGHDGHLHWCGYIGEGKELETIVAFDLTSETFCEIPFPNSILDGKHVNLLGVMMGELCVMSWYEGENEAVDVWVMEEYGVTESWVKHHVFSVFRDQEVYGFTSHNEFLAVDDDCHILLYNPFSYKYEILENICYGSRRSDKVVEYVESLVWVAPAKHKMVDGEGQS